MRQVPRFVIAAALLVWSVRLFAADAVMYVGTYTGKGSDGIYAFHFDTGTGAARPMGLMAKTPNPSFLAWGPKGVTLYAVNETEDFEGQKSGSVTMFERGADNRLTERQQFSSHGADPCHVAVGAGGRILAIANYTGGNFAWFPLRGGGEAIPAQVSIFTGDGTGPNTARQDAPHGHSVNFSPDGRYLLATDLGTDQILIRRVQDGRLIAGRVPSVKVHAGAGPRHAAFSANGKYVYVVNELDSTVVAYRFHNGELSELQRLTTLPGDFKGQNTAAEIEIDPTGKFLYASSRGNDSIAGFAVNRATGKLAPAGITPSGGKQPRSFTIDPEGHFLLAANQGSANVVVFRIDAANGALTPTGVTLSVNSPVCLLFAR